LVAPITDVGFTALSDEISTKRSAPTASAASAIDSRAEEVVRDGVGRVILHQRHVLVGRGVEDDVRTQRRPAELKRPLGDRQRRAARLPALDVSEASAELAIDLEERVLRSLHEDDAARDRTTRRSAQAREPIEPPAPVMSTRLPLQQARDDRFGINRERSAVDQCREVDPGSGPGRSPGAT
jgi:hypothetical protein